MDEDKKPGWAFSSFPFDHKFLHISSFVYGIILLVFFCKNNLSTNIKFLFVLTESRNELVKTLLQNNATEVMENHNDILNNHRTW